VTGLARDVDDVPAFLDQERDESVSEVVGPHAGEADGVAGASPDIAVPRLPLRVIPDAIGGAREDERPEAQADERFATRRSWWA
jgi:hypothetical protein